MFNSLYLRLFSKWIYNWFLSIALLWFRYKSFVCIIWVGKKTVAAGLSIITKDICCRCWYFLSKYICLLLLLLNWLNTWLGMNLLLSLSILLISIKDRTLLNIWPLLSCLLSIVKKIQLFRLGGCSLAHFVNTLNNPLMRYWSICHSLTDGNITALILKNSLLGNSTILLIKSCLLLSLPLPLTRYLHGFFKRILESIFHQLKSISYSFRTSNS